MKLDKLKFAQVIAYISSFYYMDAENIDRLDQLIDIAVPTQPVNTANCSDVDNLMALMVEGTRRIEAVKAYRVLTGAGLKEAKDAVEKYWTSNKPDTRVNRMLKEIDEQINDPDNEQDYFLNNESSLSRIKDFIKSFNY